MDKKVRSEPAARTSSQYISDLPNYNPTTCQGNPKSAIILHGSHTIHALYGISSEVYHRPSISLKAKVGISKKWLEERNHLDNLPLPDASDYVVGKQLEELEAKGEIEYVLWPIRERKVVDWNGLIALWHHLLFQLLPLRLSANDSHVLLALPTSLLTRSLSSHVTSIFFTRFNCAGLALIDTCLLSCYASGVLTGASIDLGFESTEVTPVVECLPIAGAAGQIGIGTRHLIAYLASLMAKDSTLVAQLQALPPVSIFQATQIVNSAEAVSRTTSTSNPPNFGSDSLQEKLLLDFAETLLSSGQLRAPTPEESGAAAARAQEEEEEVFDVAAALVAGKEKDFVEEQERKKKEAANALANKKNGKEGPGETVVKFRGNKIKVPNTFLTRSTEPLFKPSLLDEIVGTFGIGKPSESILFAAKDLPSPSASTSEEDSTELPPSIEVLGPFAQYSLQNLSSIPSSYSLLPSLPDLISQSLLSSQLPSPSSSPILFDSLLPHGSLLRLPGLIPLILSSLSDYLAESPENKGHNSALAALAATREENMMDNEEESLMNEKQPTNARALKTPDWFPEFKERGDIAPFLGGIIYGRIIFTDPWGKSYITKQRFNEKGPTAGWIVTA